MLAIKLSRTGKNKEPHYRLIVLEKTKDPWGDYLENLGYVNTRPEPPVYDLKVERIKYWIAKGAQPTDTVHNMLVTKGIIVAPKRNVSALGAEAGRASETKSAETPAPETKPTETK
ncbi:30S ribosomal protein S16 [Candidatus Uhrbacteria bacterium]|nr:30S ribosomal protein S16 [Candidatus Uhrbacteria bacterium]